jgi:hypothetical protein
MRWLAALLASVLAFAAVGGAITWQPAVEIAAGRAERGPWRQNDSRYDYVDDPSVAIGDDGSVAVVWVDQGRKDVFFRRVGAGQAVNVSRSPDTFSWLPRIAMTDSRHVFVLWQEIIFSGGSHGGDILFARSEDGGASFSAPLNLSNSLAGDGKGRINKDVWHNGSLDLAAAPNGRLYAAWTEYEGLLWVARSNEGGKSFSPLVRIADAKPARGPSLAVAPEGAVYLAWTVGEDERADIRIAKSTDGGASFSAPRLVGRSKARSDAPKAYSDAPKLAVDAQGMVHLAYAESSRILYTRSTDGARSFSSPRAISKPNAGFPSLAIDANGGVYVVWEVSQDPRRRPRGLGFALSGDGGRSFSEPAVIPGSADPRGGWNGSFQGLLMRKLSVNRGGEIAIVNSALKDGERSRVWLIRGGTAN